MSLDAGPYMYVTGAYLVFVFLLAKLILRARPSRIVKRQLSTFIEADASRPKRPPITDVEIETEIRIGRKLEAIKLYREREGCDLKTAVDAIDAMTARLRPGS